MSILSPFVFPAAGGGGADLSSLPLTVLDVSDGSWTVSDPDSIISGVDVTNDVTTVTYNQISAGSNDYSFAANVTNISAYRAYKTLTDSSGAAIVGGDSFLLMLEIDNSANYSSDGSTQTFVGIGADPSSSVRNTAQMCGLMEQHTPGDAAPNYAAGATRASSSELFNANNEIGRGWFLVHAGQVPTIMASATGSGAPRGFTGRDPSPTLTFSASAPIYLVVGFGTRGAQNISAGDTSAQIIRYTVIKLES